jgi:hypothetical protein
MDATDVQDDSANDTVFFMPGIFYPGIFGMLISKAVEQRRSRYKAIVDFLRVQEMPFFPCMNCRKPVSARIFGVVAAERFYDLAKREAYDELDAEIERQYRAYQVDCPHCEKRGPLIAHVPSCSGVATPKGGNHGSSSGRSVLTPSPTT